MYKTLWEIGDRVQSKFEHTQGKKGGTIRQIVSEQDVYDKNIYTEYAHVKWDDNTVSAVRSLDLKPCEMEGKK